MLLWDDSSGGDFKHYVIVALNKVDFALLFE